MKFIQKSFLLLSILLFGACASDSNEGTPAIEGLLELSETTLTAEAEGFNTTIDLHSSSQCTITGGMGWVITTPQDGKIAVEIKENLGQKARTAILKVTNAEQQCKEITVTQQAYAFNPTHHYKMPVVFHVLYYKETDEHQYVREGHLAQLLEKVNDYYDQCGIDLPIDFVPVTHTPEGELLPEVGVHRIKTNRSTYDPSMFLGSGKKEYVEMMWDPAQYINVFIYKFKDSLVAGISQFPILPEPYNLDGINNLKAGSDINAIPYPQCVCINNSFIYDLPKNEDDYQMGNPVVTLAHELGHFFGLFHAFNQTIQGNTNWNQDTDYCTDTEPYNKYLYDQKLQSYLNANGYITSKASEAYAKYVMRTHCKTSQQFRSTNIMDYAVSDANKLTPQQAKRINYILHHALYRPGPKDYSQADIVEKSATRQVDATHFQPHYME